MDRTGGSSPTVAGRMLEKRNRHHRQPHIFTLDLQITVAFGWVIWWTSPKSKFQINVVKTWYVRV